MPRPFWFLWAGGLVNRLGFFVEPFLALYLVQARGLPKTTAGAVVAAFGLGAFASQPLGGYLADRVGRRATLAGGMLASATTMFALALAQPVWLIAALAVLAGLAIDVYRPASSALVADLVPAAERPRAFGLLYWAINLGVSVAAFAGGLLAEHGYWLLFVLDGVTCLGFAAIVWFGVPETLTAVRRAAGHQHAGGPSHGYGAALRDRLLIALAGATLASALVYMQSFVTLPLSMRADGLGPSAYGFAYAVNPVAVIVLQPLTLRWLKAAPMIAVYAGSSLVMGVGFGLTAFATTTLTYAATVLVWTLGEIAFNAVGPAIIADIAPADARGRYNGVLGLAYGAAAFLAPLAGTGLMEHVGEAAVWGGCVAMSVVSAAAAVVVAPAITRRRAKVAT